MLLDAFRREELGEEADLGGLADPSIPSKVMKPVAVLVSGAASGWQSCLRFGSQERGPWYHTGGVDSGDGRGPPEHAFDTDVLVDVRPVHALARPMRRKFDRCQAMLR